MIEKIKKAGQITVYSTIMIVVAAGLFIAANLVDDKRRDTTSIETVAASDGTISGPPQSLATYGMFNAYAAEDHEVAGPEMFTTTTTSTTTNVVTTTTYTIPVYGVSKEEAINGDLDDKKKYIWDFFVDKGYDEIAISGIIGNMMAEDPTLTGSNTSAGLNDGTYTDGIIQWDPFSKHQSWANENGYEWYDIEGQLEHVHEMFTYAWASWRVDEIVGYRYKDTDIVYYYIDGSDYATGCDNVAQSAVAFERGIEGSIAWSDDRCEKRIGFAYEVYNELSGRV